MAHITIATATHDDIESVWQWGYKNPELLGSDDDEWYSKETLQQWILHPENKIFLVVHQEGKPVGFAMTFYLRGWARLDSLFVDKEHRGNGIGTMLVKKTMRSVKKKGLEEFDLIVREDKPIVQQFYEKLGFKKGYRYIWMQKRYG